jgi:hypothetical protein
MSFEIGRRIVEHEQQGVQRAEYGKLVLKTLSERLTAEFGKRFSEDSLSLMRKFYIVYRDRKPISETVSGKSLQPATEEMMSSRSQISETLSRKLFSARNVKTSSVQFTLGRNTSSTCRQKRN